MDPRQSRKAKRPRSGERPFPWRCRHCGKREVALAKTDYAAEVRHDGRLYTFTIPDLELPVCGACGERVFTEKVDAQVNDALRGHLNLLDSEMRRTTVRRTIAEESSSSRGYGKGVRTL